MQASSRQEDLTSGRRAACRADDGTRKDVDCGTSPAGCPALTSSGQGRRFRAGEEDWGIVTAASPPCSSALPSTRQEVSDEADLRHVGGGIGHGGCGTGPRRAAVSVPLSTCEPWNRRIRWTMSCGPSAKTGEQLRFRRSHSAKRERSGEDDMTQLAGSQEAVILSGSETPLYLEFHGRVIPPLGIQMYQSPVNAIAANAWDADANEVEIKLPETVTHPDATFLIRDNEIRMDFDECQDFYLAATSSASSTPSKAPAGFTPYSTANLRPTTRGPVQPDAHPQRTPTSSLERLRGTGTNNARGDQPQELTVCDNGASSIQHKWVSHSPLRPVSHRRAQAARFGNTLK